MVRDLALIDSLWDFAIDKFKHRDLNERSYAIETTQAHFKDFFDTNKNHGQILEMLSVVYVAQHAKELQEAGFTKDEIEAELNKYGGSIKQASAPV